MQSARKFSAVWSQTTSKQQSQKGLAKEKPHESENSTVTWSPARSAHLGHHIGTQIHDDTPRRVPTNGDIKVALGIGPVVVITKERFSSVSHQVTFEKDSEPHPISSGRGNQYFPGCHGRIIIGKYTTIDGRRASRQSSLLRTWCLLMQLKEKGDGWLDEIAF